ncbi:MAG: hypothetical protein MUF14_02785 [Hyphomonadaceae bacterium]|nr:hypothetical protein [Hyphomonadaceae bacterium]
MRFLTTILACLAALTLMPRAASAFVMDPAWVAARGGSLGVGGEVAIQIVPMITLRGIGQGFDLDYNETVDGIAYRGTMELGSLGAQVDVRPPLSPLYLTVGTYANNNALAMTATPSAPVQIGGTTYSPAQIGTITTDVDFGDQAFYGGLGVELSLGPISAALEGGLYYQGEPDVRFATTGTAGGSTFNADVLREQAQIADELDKLRFWPAITLTARWKF